VPVVAAGWLLLLCTTTTLAATVLYADTIALGGLRQAVTAADPATRGVDVRVAVDVGLLPATDALVRPQVTAALRAVDGPVVRVARSDPMTSTTSDPATTKDLVVLSELEGLDGHARLAAGSWAVAGRSPIEATLSTAAAGALGLHLGDRVSLVDIRDTKIKAQLAVVGLWTPIDPDDGYWLGDGLELDGTVPGAGFTTRGPFVVPGPDLAGRGITHAVSVEWRAAVPVDALTLENAQRLSDEVDALPSRITTALPRLAQPKVSTGLPALLDSVSRSLAVSWASILLLTLQFAVLAAYAVLLVAGMLVERRRGESALLRSRGASTGHLTAMALIESVLLAVPAVVLAPILALAIVRLIALARPAVAPAIALDPAFVLLPAAAAILAGLGCVVVLLLPTVVSGTGAAGIRAALGRPLGRTLAQRAGLDVALVIVAAIALWQLELYGAPLTRNAKGALGADPLLVAAPAIALVAGSLVAIRALPRLAEVGERLLARRAGLMGALGSRQLARRPLHSTRSVLLLVLAVALGTFAAAYSATWSRSQVEQATYRAAADVRAVANDYPTLPAWGTASVVGAVPGVTAAMPVSRSNVDLGRTVQSAQLLGIDAARVGTIAVVDPTSGAPAVESSLAQLAASRPAIGIALPGRPARLRVTLDADLRRADGGVAGVGADAFTSVRGLDLAVVLADGNGRIARIPAGSALLAGAGQQLIVSLSGRSADVAIGVVQPVRLEAIEISPNAPLFVPVAGNVTLRGVAVSEAGSGDSWADVRLGAAAPGWRWLNVTGGGLPTTSVAGRSFGRIEFGESAPLFVSNQSPPTYRLWDTTGTGSPVPAIVSDRFLALAGLRVGDAVTVSSGGSPLHLQIVAAAGFFAPLDPTVPFVVVDGPTLDLDRFAAIGFPTTANEWWLSVAPGEAASVGDALSRPPFAAKAVVARDDVARSLASDPVSVGVIGALALGAIAALAFAVIGFLANAAVATAERLGDLVVLRALGVSGRQLIGWLAVESALLLGVGLVAGAGLGALLAHLVLPFASLAANGSPPVPPPAVIVPFEALAPIYASGVFLLVVALVIVGREVPPVHVGGAIRERAE
jgi:FtsX-like permease family